jgi:hypothetical protein
MASTLPIHSLYLSVIYLLLQCDFATSLSRWSDREGTKINMASIWKQWHIEINSVKNWQNSEIGTLRNGETSNSTVFRMIVRYFFGVSESVFPPLPLQLALWFALTIERSRNNNAQLLSLGFKSP